MKNTLTESGPNLQPTSCLRPSGSSQWLSVGIPQPPPDTWPLPPASHPVPPSPAVPPEITEPTLPGQNEPVREPTEPPTVPMDLRLH